MNLAQGRKRSVGCESNSRMRRSRNARETLETLLALDRMVVELSLRTYGVSRHQRSLMRKQNRRLHHAVRKHLPQFLETARRQAFGT